MRLLFGWLRQGGLDQRVGQIVKVRVLHNHSLRRLRVSVRRLDNGAEPLLAFGGGNQMASGFNPAAGFGIGTRNGTSPVVVVVTQPAPANSGTPVRVSSGVSRGLLIEPIRPVYPVIAKAARQQGTVTVTAVIDRTGRIVNAQVVDGPTMLRDAALTAVRDARYRPYLLNGQPTEVVTTVSITFTMAG